MGDVGQKATMERDGVLDVEALGLVRVQLPPATHRRDDALRFVTGPVSAAVVLVRPVAEPAQDRRRCIVGHLWNLVACVHHFSRDESGQT